MHLLVATIFSSSLRNSNTSLIKRLSSYSPVVDVKISFIYTIPCLKASRYIAISPRVIAPFIVECAINNIVTNTARAFKRLEDGVLSRVFFLRIFISSSFCFLKLSVKSDLKYPPNPKSPQFSRRSVASEEPVIIGSFSYLRSLVSVEFVKSG